MNNVVLIGRLVRDPQLIYIKGSGTPVANFTLAIDREYKDKDGKRETDYIDIQVWNKSAENCANYIVKGSLVCIQGSIRVESYMKDDERRKVTRVTANSVKFLDNKNKFNKDNLNFKNAFTPTGLDYEEWDERADDMLF